MEVEPTVLAEPDPSDADSLVSSNDPDDLGNEQTWPTEEEMQGSGAVSQSADGTLPDATTGTTPKIVKRIPKGMSEYQAAWIIDEDNDDDDVADDGSQAGMEDVEDEEMVDMPIHIDGEEIELDSRKSVAFQDLEAEEEEKQWDICRIIDGDANSCFYFTGSRHGAIVSGKKKTILRSPTKLIHQRRFPPASDSSATAGCGRSGPVRGIRTKISQEIMPVYFSLKTSSGLNAECAGERSRKVVELK